MSSHSCDATGDGSRPRTAALCAMLSKWKCVSVDPMMDYDSPSKMKFVMKVDNRKGITSSIIEQWTTIRNLVIVRDKVQNITVRCRRAIVVLMHSHVTLTDALACVDATHGIVGIFSCPCCQWEPHQNHLPNDAEGGAKKT